VEIAPGKFPLGRCYSARTVHARAGQNYGASPSGRAARGGQASV